jgi:hypothetical protein
VRGERILVLVSALPAMIDSKRLAYTEAGFDQGV